MPRVSKKNKEAIKPLAELTEVITDPNPPVSQSVSEIKQEEFEKTAAYIASEKVKRNKFGLLSGVEHKFNEDGFVNWRGMVKAEYLIPNKDKFDVNVDLDAIDITQVEDHKLIILLGGLKDLAQLRGYSKVDHEVIAASQGYCAVKCTVTWFGNYETGGREVVTSALAETHESNTDNFATDYLLSIAENRAFARAIRSFLKINIVSKEELGSRKGTGAHVQETSEKSSQSSSFSPAKTLAVLMDKKGISFEQIKAKLIKEEYSGAAELQSLEDIGGNKIFELINRLKAVPAGSSR